MDVNWDKLAQIEELQDYFQADYAGFQQLIQQRMQELAQVAPPELDKLALVRVLEVTNGCTQWGFRRQDEQSLSVEQARECMQVVIGFIKRQRIELPSGETIQFAPATGQLMTAIRDLYQDAFKKNLPGARRDYYAYSVAQFIVYGRQRMQWAMDLVQQQFESMFSAYYVQRGRRYIAPYLEAMVDP